MKIQCAALLMISNLIAGNPFAANAESERPNIVVVLADDMGWGDSGTYGHLVIKTPNLDKLASKGVKLTQCYSTCGVCSPSRSAILSGRHPYRNGVWRTHVSLPGDRVALRIGDWKLVGNDTLTKFKLYEIQKDWKEENDLAATMPDKTEEMKLQLLEAWKDLGTERPDEWWNTERNKPARSGTPTY